MAVQVIELKTRFQVIRNRTPKFLHLNGTHWQKIKDETNWMPKTYDPACRRDEFMGLVIVHELSGPMFIK